MYREQILELIGKWWVEISTFGAVAAIWIKKAKSIVEVSKKAAHAVKFYFTFPFILDKKISENCINLDKRLNDQDMKLSVIEKEVTPNGGGSMKDVLNSVSNLALIANLRTKQIIATHPVAIYECEPVNGRCITANSVLCDLFGLSEAQMLGAGWLSALSSSDRQNCWESFQKAIESDIPYEWNYTIVNHKTKETHKCRTEMVVLRDQKGRPILYQGVVEVVE
jgi:PAS domain S-box-containing protein